MIRLDQIRADKLVQLARDRFDSDLSHAEIKVLRDSASSEEPFYLHWDKQSRPEIRPEFVRWLATDPEAAPYIDHKGLRVDNVTITGNLDLSRCHVNPALEFRRCDFQGIVNLLSAETRGIFILDSSLAGGIFADGVTIHGPLILRHIHSESEIRLSGAQIESILDCSGAKLNAKGEALIADGAKIRGEVSLEDGFESEGTIRLPSAEITGQLKCSGAKLRAKGNALIADGAQIGDGVFLDDGFESEGTIRLLGAEIKGDLSCLGAKLKTKYNALIADGAKIGGSVFLEDGFESEGTIRLLDAKITGQLNCSGAKLMAKDNALNAAGAKIGGDVFLDDSFESEGEILLFGAKIGGNLHVRSAKVAGVICKNTVVTGDMIWQRIEKSKGTFLNLVGAMVKNLRDDRMSWPDEGNLDLDGLIYEGLKLYEPLSDENIKNHTYSKEMPLVAKDRIAWLELQSVENASIAQPWVQLANLLNASGDPGGAREVRYAYQRRLHGRDVLLRGRTYPFDQLEQWPLEICAPITFFWLLGSLIFWRAHRMSMMAPTEKEAFEVFQKTGKPPERYVPLNPFIYALENVLPVVKLGQDSSWYPNPQAAPGNWLPNRPKWLKNTVERWAITRWIFRLNYRRLASLRWVLILFGWALAIILATALAEHFRK